MLNRKNVTRPLLIFFITLMAVYSNIASADAYPMEEKLKQCKQAFALSHKKDATQKMAVAARLEHLKLMKEMLIELNKMNADRKMTDSELQENVMVMSHLLEMLVTENLDEKERTWNLNY